MRELNPMERSIVNACQLEFPLVPRPFASLAQSLNIGEETIIETLRILSEEGILARIGAVVRAGAIGASTLAAMQVPPDRLEDVATAVSSHPEVNHNYVRENAVNLWFVVVAPTSEDLQKVLDQIEAEHNIPIMPFRLVEAFCIDLGFAL